ncbi:unnamed protein product, partial [Mesorhabditis spiculigera]
MPPKLSGSKNDKKKDKSGGKKPEDKEPEAWDQIEIPKGAYLEGLKIRDARQRDKTYLKMAQAAAMLREQATCVGNQVTQTGGGTTLANTVVAQRADDGFGSLMESFLRDLDADEKMCRPTEEVQNFRPHKLPKIWAEYARARLVYGDRVMPNWEKTCAPDRMVKPDAAEELPKDSGGPPLHNDGPADWEMAIDDITDQTPFWN